MKSASAWRWARASRTCYGMVLGQGLRLTLVGLGLGLVLSFALTRFLSSLLLGVTSTDALTFSRLLLLCAVAFLPASFPGFGRCESSRWWRYATNETGATLRMKFRRRCRDRRNQDRVPAARRSYLAGRSQGVVAHGRSWETCRHGSRRLCKSRHWREARPALEVMYRIEGDCPICRARAAQRAVMATGPAGCSEPGAKSSGRRKNTGGAGQRILFGRGRSAMERAADPATGLRKDPCAKPPGSGFSAFARRESGK